MARCSLDGVGTVDRAGRQRRRRLIDGCAAPRLAMDASTRARSVTRRASTRNLDVDGPCVEARDRDSVSRRRRRSAIAARRSHRTGRTLSRRRVSPAQTSRALGRSECRSTSAKSVLGAMTRRIGRYVDVEPGTSRGAISAACSTFTTSEMLRRARGHGHVVTSRSSRWISSSSALISASISSSGRGGT